MILQQVRNNAAENFRCRSGRIEPQRTQKAVKNRIKKQKIALLRSLKRVSMYLALQCAATIPQAGNTLLGTQAATTGKNPRRSRDGRNERPGTGRRRIAETQGMAD